jgi:dUTP pyrophosphatase
MLQVQIKLLCDHAILPQQMSAQAAGYDLSAALESEVILPAGERFLCPTGLAMALPVGYEAQIRPRSGLAIKHGIGILNSPGTIDADYRGEVKVILFNASSDDFVITPGMRIAQMVISAVVTSELIKVDELSETDRDAGGFGHTGY